MGDLCAYLRDATWIFLKNEWEEKKEKWIPDVMCYLQGYLLPWMRDQKRTV